MTPKSSPGKKKATASSVERGRSQGQPSADLQIKELHKLAQELIREHEEQRREVSRELHDNVAQVLAAASARLDLTKKKSTKLAVIHDLDQLKQDLVRALEEVRQFARDLRPAALDSFCLCKALESHIANMRKRVPIDLVFDSRVERHDLLNAEFNTHLFRIAQEALNNIEKHSAASQAWVRLRLDKTSLNLEIGDNGHSFHAARLAEAQKNGHLGLLAMRERAEMLGGELLIQAEPGAGTTIQATIPLNGHLGHNGHKNHEKNHRPHH